MKFYSIIIAIITILLSTFNISIFAEAGETKKPALSGIFYPEEPQELSRMLDEFLSAAPSFEMDEDIFALIVPHAGYGYSGRTAAYAYKLLQRKEYKTIVIIGVSHHYGFNGVSVYRKGKFLTPLGAVEIDEEFTQKLLEKDKEIYFEPQAFLKEHSIEVQIPFLQKIFKEFKIVPIVTGDCTLETCKKITSLLKEAIGNRKDILVVISTDMYHGYDYEELKKIDNRTISYITQMDVEGLYYALREGKAQLCGGFGVVIGLMLSKELGWQKVKLLNHTDSATVTGKKIKGLWTVGYGAFVITSRKGEENMFNPEQRKRLLTLARNAIEHYLKTGKKVEVKESDSFLLKELAAFVTLRKDGQLRGCIGNLIADKPLYLTVRDMAIEAATSDFRFLPVNMEELKDIEIEISVLSPLKKIDNWGKIRLGIDGVLIRKGFRSGVFLPQVALETGWSKEEFLSHLCLKAGLSADAWKEDKDIEFYTFTAEVFSEKE